MIGKDVSIAYISVNNFGETELQSLPWPKKDWIPLRLKITSATE